MRTPLIIASVFMVLIFMNLLQADREPAVAGSFYPQEKEKLHTLVQQKLQDAHSYQQQNINAIIVPHAGYQYSADVAAQAYKTLNKRYKHIFIIGSSHHTNFNGVSIYDKGDYITPLGKVHVDQKIVKELISTYPFITYKKEAHEKEHTIEVQLPFLQTIYKEDELSIIPIIVATSDIQTIKKLSKSLQRYFNDENLFIISTDLSHFPKQEDAKKVDKELLDALTKNSPNTLIDTIIKNENSKIENLQTSACGWSSLLTLLYMSKDENYTYELLKYKNSGESDYGDKDRVVGYASLRVYKKDNNFYLSYDDKQKLKEIAKLALYKAVLENEKVTITPDSVSKKLKLPLGAFVTLHLNSKLRGCIGRFEPDMPLYQVVIDMAVSASRYDNRFHPVTKDELANIDIEISVLTPRKKILSKDDIVLGRDGIYIEYGSKNGTYLPQVATDMGWSVDQFVSSCCLEKAGIDKKECDKADIYTYQAIIF